MNVFDIIGPVMIGPSSSHTAGAARAGLVARRLLGDEPVEADITLYGSFAMTYFGHGTDRAIIGGILGFELDDARLRDSFGQAENSGLKFSFELSDKETKNPNTVKIILRGKSGTKTEVVVESVGGGVVNVVNIDGSKVSFSAEYDTIVIFNEDKSGIVAGVSGVFAKFGVNIAFMRVFRKYEGKDAIMVIEIDSSVDEKIFAELNRLDHVRKVITIPAFGK